MECIECDKNCNSIDYYIVFGFGECEMCDDCFNSKLIYIEEEDIFIYKHDKFCEDSTPFLSGKYSYKYLNKKYNLG